METFIGKKKLKTKMMKKKRETKYKKAKNLMTNKRLKTKTKTKVRSQIYKIVLCLRLSNSEKVLKLSKGRVNLFMLSEILILQ